ncbi:MAG: hypothetical protein MUF06_12915 [Pirellulaceae bacterium]|nr:hypothetical protein [Pirellulaceae bacterium]
MKALRLLYGTISSTEFGHLAFEALRQWWIDRGLSRGTINRYCHRARRIFSWGVSEQLIPPAVVQSLREVKGLREGRSAAREGEGMKPVDDATLP